MAENSLQDRTEKATPKRRQDARKKGQVAQSREVSSVMILLMSLGVFSLGGSWMFWNLAGYMGDALRTAAQAQIADIPAATVFLIQVARIVFKVLLPLLLVVVVAGVAGNILQSGFLISTEALAPKWSKLNPVSGMKRLFSLRSLVELFKSIVKILFVATVAYLMVKQELDLLPSLMRQSVPDIFVFAARVAFKICLNVCLALILLTILDYAYQRWEHEKSLKMTKQEIKDENKQTEGDPKVKARIRSIQMEAARQRMMAAVPQADVVITNPTHLAVALRFDAARMIAPQVVAKGAGFVAERIRSIAVENDVPLVEDKPLARTLYKIVEVGHTIPADLYKAVAEVLAYVYRLRGLRPTSR
ncbi:MAG: flagellar biosynthesis protein FlhB [Desulfobacterales bacterium]